MKKILSFVLCAVMAFSAMCGAAPAFAPADISLAASAAEQYNKKMLPYCYSELSEREQRFYLQLRTAVIDHKKKVSMQISKDTLNKLWDIMTSADALTFNAKDCEYYYNPKTKIVSEINFRYYYSKEDYDSIIKKCDKAADKIISKFSDNMTKYAKIKYIHDYLCLNVEYKLSADESAPENFMHGALVNRKAECDGYSYAFMYICGKAGIKAVLVPGKADGNDGKGFGGHAWNKVYYNKNWYNVDVTFDDSSPYKNYISHTYFMVSDKNMKNHKEDKVSYTIPAASADDLNYYKKNKLYAENTAEAKKLLAKEIVKTAKKGGCIVEIMVPKRSVYDDLCKYDGFFDALDAAEASSELGIVTEFVQAAYSDSNVISICFFRKGTTLSDYYNDVSQVSAKTKASLKKVGITDKPAEKSDKKSK